MNEPSVRMFYPWFTILSLTVGCLVIAAYCKDQFPEWKTWQRKYIKQEMARAVTPEQRAMAARLPVKILQVVLPELDRVDRCTTCHVAVEDPSYGGYPQPLAYHPNHDQHPLARFGCTICHGGQGRATTLAAHGYVQHWDRPMLPMTYIEASCAKCHLPSDIPQAPRLAQGQAVFQDVGCIGCHKLNGTGGTIGPKLDDVGARHSPEWLVRHFRNPGSVSPGSAMPPVNVHDDDLEALTLYVLSFTGEPIGAYYVSMKTIPGLQAGRRLFMNKGCSACHAVNGEGGNIGPPLDDVAERRDTEWIVRHFRDPQAVTPGSVMPKFNLSEQEIRALTEFLLSINDSNVVGFLKTPARLTPVERGQRVFTKYGCAGCHGRDGQGGIPNPNAKTSEQVPGLKYVKEGYTLDELKRRILDGQREIPPLDPAAPHPPLYMPAWRGRIQQGEMSDLIAYLISLYPEEEDLGF